MFRSAPLLALASLLLGACSSSDAPLDSGMESEEQLVGGWDGASTSGTSVLLLREGLAGTLSATHLVAADREYQISFSVSGEMAEDDESVLLALSCAEVRMRPLAAEVPSDEPEDSVPSSTDDETEEEPTVDEPVWDALDCSGWGLELECGTAGDCGGNDCNLFCDVTYFGDAFATAAIELASVEDELDHWQRV